MLRDYRAKMFVSRRRTISGIDWPARNAQNAFLLQFSHTDCGIKLHRMTHAEVFSLTLPRVGTIHAKGKRIEEPPDRPLTPSPHQKEAVYQMIGDRLWMRNYKTSRRMLNFAETPFRKTVTYGRLESFF
jgi:hypothetical protein